MKKCFAGISRVLHTRPLPAQLIHSCAISVLAFVVSAGICAAADDTTSPTANLLVFSPTAIMLENPRSPGSPSRPSTVTMNITAYDSNGNILSPSADHPLHVQVYGAPDGVITPTEMTITTPNDGSSTNVQFTYNGAFFPNNIELAAWIPDPHAGASLATTLFVQKNRISCAMGARSFDLNMLTTVPDPISVKAAVGADAPSSAKWQTFTIDTGSLGVIVPAKDLIKGPQVIGPGAPGQKFYDSSGYIFSGNYYLAPVTLELKDHTLVHTNPIMVLAINKVTCDPSYTHCKNPGPPDLHYLGVGFDRNTSGTGDLFNSPSSNAFLQLTDRVHGTDINQGYLLSTQGVTVGLTDAVTHGFGIVPLETNTTVAGDWEPIHGCYSFPELSGAPQFCGNLLLDVGISQMYLDLESQDRPQGSYDTHDRVPDHVKMNIVAGVNGVYPMDYSFRAVQPPEQPQGPEPKYAQWYDTSKVFVNTGRRPLLEYNYFYSGQCGEAGFQQYTD